MVLIACLGVRLLVQSTPFSFLLRLPRRSLLLVVRPLSIAATLSSKMSSSFNGLSGSEQAMPILIVNMGPCAPACSRTALALASHSDEAPAGDVGAAANDRVNRCTAD